jgi:2-polyprenyl-6-methoxyphenol hydroxylase-like FAD-dependent oxidoreductase
MTPDDYVICCIAGCGPAGAMLGLLLARAGVDVLVLEKHSDFLRDFRGDTIHPSTMELMEEIGLAERVLGLRHSKASQLMVETPQGRAVVADFSRLPTPYPYITFLPQWDFLNLLTAEAKRLPTFRLLMNAPARKLLVEDGMVRGLGYDNLMVGRRYGHCSRSRPADGIRRCGPKRGWSQWGSLHPWTCCGFGSHAGQRSPR